MGEINLPASAPKASSESLEPGRNSSSVQVVLSGTSRAFPAAPGGGRWEGLAFRLSSGLALYGSSSAPVLSGLWGKSKHG